MFTVGSVDRYIDFAETSLTFCQHADSWLILARSVIGQYQSVIDSHSVDGRLTLGQLSEDSHFTYRWKVG